MLKKRRRFKQTESLQDRLVAFAKEARDTAVLLIGVERSDMLKKARQADTAAHLDKMDKFARIAAAQVGQRSKLVRFGSMSMPAPSSDVSRSGAAP